MTYHSDIAHSDNTHVGGKQRNVLVSSSACFVATATILSLPSVPLALAGGLAMLGSLSLTGVSLASAEHNEASHNFAYAGILGCLLAVSKTVTFGAFGLAGYGAVIVCMTLFFALIVAELVSSSIVAGMFAKLIAKQSSRIGIALNISSRLFGSLGRIHS